jgi:hypothetical protein
MSAHPSSDIKQLLQLIDDVENSRIDDIGGGLPATRLDRAVLSTILRRNGRTDLLRVVPALSTNPLGLAVVEHITGTEGENRDLEAWMDKTAAQLQDSLEYLARFHTSHAPTAPLPALTQLLETSFGEQYLSDGLYANPGLLTVSSMAVTPALLRKLPTGLVNGAIIDALEAVDADEAEIRALAHVVQARPDAVQRLPVAARNKIHRRFPFSALMRA